jgi:DNA-binding response OmpR family regulator
VGGLSGVGLCKILRESSGAATPLLVLVPWNTDVDRILALEAGADDVVSWPASPREVALRVRAILRHANGSKEEDVQTKLECGALGLDPATGCLEIGGTPVPLTRREFGVLELLISNAGRVVSREEIFAQLWGRSSKRKPRVVDTYIKQIRRKLGEHGSHIQTLRGFGYRVRSDLTHVPESAVDRSASSLL